jgi:hypothetical protein
MVRRHSSVRLLQWLLAAVRPAAEGAADHAGLLLRHARRGFFELADIAKRPGMARRANRSPDRAGGGQRLDALFEIERVVNGRSVDERYAVRQEKNKPLLDDMHTWLLRERDTLSRSCEVLKPINYMLRCRADFARFINDRRICLSNNAAERALRGIALERRNWTFAGSQRGAERAAVMLILIPRHASTTPTRKPGLPTSWSALPIFPPRACTN